METQRTHNVKFNQWSLAAGLAGIIFSVIAAVYWAHQIAVAIAAAGLFAVLAYVLLTNRPSCRTRWIYISLGFAGLAVVAIVQLGAEWGLMLAGFDGVAACWITYLLCGSPAASNTS